MNGSAGDRATVTHLGILVVYFLAFDDDIALLELHLERIRRHTKVPYTLFAVAPRLSENARRRVTDAPHVVMCDVPPTPRRGSREHGYYLDAMVPLALETGVSHLCTLDVDSFPIDDGWIDSLVGDAPPESGLSAVLREENGDVALLHPSCIFAPRAFFLHHHPSFWPEPESTPEFQRFVRATHQRADTGIRLASTVWNAQLPWRRLRRTNVENPHFLLAGIYGDIVYHMGGINRDKVFRTDINTSRMHTVSRAIKHVPMPGARLKAAQRSLARRVRRRADALIRARNGAVYQDLRARLLRDSDDFIAYLRGTQTEGIAEPEAMRKKVGA